MQIIYLFYWEDLQSLSLAHYRPWRSCPPCWPPRPPPREPWCPPRPPPPPPLRLSPGPPPRPPPCPIRKRKKLEEFRRQFSFEFYLHVHHRHDLEMVDVMVVLNVMVFHWRLLWQDREYLLAIVDILLYCHERNIREFSKIDHRPTIRKSLSSFYDLFSLKNELVFAYSWSTNNIT